MIVFFDIPHREREAMTLTKIKYFLEVARSLNFTKAAELLFIAQPNLSKHIAQMEEEIGVQLFVRTKRSVELTEAGQLLFNQLDGIPQQIENSFEQARALGQEVNGRISIGILEAQDMNKALLDKLQNFGDRFPHMEIILERNGFSRLRKGLANGYYDAIITLGFDIEDLPEFESRIILKQDEGAIAINRKNPLSKKKNLSLKDLKDENFVIISPEESPKGYQRFFEECSSFGFAPRVVRQLSSLESLILCVETGLGIALLDRNTRLEKDSEVCVVTIPDSSPADLVVAWRKERKKPTVDSLIQSLTTGHS